VIDTVRLEVIAEPSVWHLEHAPARRWIDRITPQPEHIAPALGARSAGMFFWPARHSASLSVKGVVRRPLFIEYNDAPMAQRPSVVMDEKLPAPEIPKRLIVTDVD
jgi:hypothetical protein